MGKKKDRARADASSHDDFYRKLRERVAGWAKQSSINPKYRDYVLALPDLFHLVVKLMFDKRVDSMSKAALGVAVAYAVSPFDLLPDVLGPLGVVDDLLVLVLALDFMLDRTPRAVVQEHWAGGGDVFVLIRSVLDQADKWVGRGLYDRIRKLMGRTTDAGKARASAAGASRKTAARKTPATRKSISRKSTAKRKPAAKAAPAGAAVTPTKRPLKKRTTRRKAGSQA